MNQGGNWSAEGCLAAAAPPERNAAVGKAFVIDMRMAPLFIEPDNIDRPFGQGFGVDIPVVGRATA